MNRLMVSYNAGMSYNCDRMAEKPEEFAERCEELDRRGLRWTIEDEAGNIDRRYVCRIFQGILSVLEESLEESLAKEGEG